MVFALLAVMGCTKEGAGGGTAPAVSEETAQLEMVCKVWGLVKYFHPVYAEENYLEECDIDKELFMLVEQMDGLDRKGVRQMLVNWIDGLGPFESSEEMWTDHLSSNKLPSGMEKGRQLADLSWIYNTEYLGADLSAKLVQVYNGVRKTPSRYAYRFTSGGMRGKETPYPEMVDPPLEYRLLALFRYWNIIEYFFPAKYLTDTPWDEVLRECIPIFVAAEGAREYETAVCRMTAKICDTHGLQLLYLHPEEKNYLPYFSFEIIGEKIYVSRISPNLAVPHTIKVGDEVVKINGMTYREAKKEVTQYYSLSNIASANMLIKKYIILITEGNSMPITFVSDGVQKTEEFPTVPVPPFQPASDLKGTFISWGAFDEQYKLLNDGRVGYFNPGISSNTSLSQIFAEFRDTEGIVVDMRSYPELDIRHIPYRFIDNTDRPFVKMTYPDPFFPGHSWVSSDYTTGYYANYVQEGTYNGKVVVLVNGDTQSAAEFATMAFQTLPNAVVVGSQTAGADGNIAYIDLPGGIRPAYSGLGVWYPDGTEAQRYGVKIDREVHRTVEGLKAGTDELLDAALDIILNGK